MPASDAEKALLAPFPDAVRPDVMDGTYAPPVSDGSGTDRTTLRKAFEILKAAGYERKGDALVNTATGAPLAFEVLVREAEDENLALAMQRTCALLGVKIGVRRVESLQFEVRIKDFDYDMIRFVYPVVALAGERAEQSLVLRRGAQPGLVQLRRRPLDPAIDAMIEALLSATEQRRLRHRGPRARPRAHLRLLYDPALLRAGRLVGAAGRGSSIRPRAPSTAPEPTTWWAKQ